jgi:aminoglycoside phosphotransferase (APT) family kinase protein
VSDVHGRASGDGAPAGLAIAAARTDATQQLVARLCTHAAIRFGHPTSGTSARSGHGTEPDVPAAHAVRAIAEVRGDASIAVRFLGTDLPSAWHEPLELVDSVSADAVRQLRGVLEWCAREDVPAPVVLDGDSDGGALGRPWLLLGGTTGRPLSEHGGRGRGGLESARRLADLSARVHDADPSGAPLADRPALVDRRLSTLERLVVRRTDPAAERGLDLLADRSAVVRRGRPAVCHGELDPAHVIRRDDGRSVIIGWQQATIGDPLDDVAGTLHSLRRGPHATIGAPVIARSFLRRYATLRAVDPERLRYWSAVHAFTAWVGQPKHAPGTAALRHRFERAAARLDDRS